MPTILLLTLLSTLGAHPAHVEVVALDGATTVGNISAISGEDVTIQTGDASETLPFKAVQLIQFGESESQPVADPAAWITLIDGSKLHAESYSVAGTDATVALFGGTKTTISTSRIRHVRFKKQNDDQAEQWAKALKVDAPGDLLVIRKDESIDYLEGLLRGVTEESVEFQLDADWIPVRRQKVEGLVYARAAGVEQATSLATLVDRAGSRIELAELKLDAGTLVITTPAGVDMRWPLDHVGRLEFVDKSVLYLSDMTPASVQWAPYFPPSESIAGSLQASFQPRRDRALGATSDDDASLKLRFFNEDGVDEVRQYARGLAIPSRTTVVFDLPETARRFKAVVGIDERVAALGHVQLIIRNGDNVLFEGDVSGRESPQSLDIDIEGAEQLTILVDFGENYDTGDHLNLCEARIVK